MQNHKKYVLSTGKEVHVYDGLVPLQLRDKIWTFLNDSSYKIGWADTHIEQGVAHKFLHSSFSATDNDRCGLLPFLRSTAVEEHLKGKVPVKSVVNLSVPSDTHWAHAHPEKLVVLYYANMVWEQHWHGETLFYTEDLAEIEVAIRYTPGRVVVFDASIPHAMRPQSTVADHYRFTYALTFD